MCAIAAKQWDDFDDFGFGGLRMMEANETGDQFDELLSQLRFDEMQPAQDDAHDGSCVAFCAACFVFRFLMFRAVDTDSLPHCSSCGGPIAGQVLMAFAMPWHPEHLGCAGTPCAAFFCFCVFFVR